MSSAGANVSLNADFIWNNILTLNLLVPTTMGACINP